MKCPRRNHLTTEIAEGHFREDLFWRLNVLPIALPPLRRRAGDVELLVNHFLKIYCAQNGKEIRKVHPEALAALVEYPWPGNVRELQNYIERSVVLAQGDELVPSLLPNSVIGDSKAAQTAVFRPTDDESLIREFVYNSISKAESDAENLFDQIVKPVEKELLLQVLESVNQTQTKAATRLGINRNTLYKKMVEFDIAKSK